jgi:hypothetical protein
VKDLKKTNPAIKKLSTAYTKSVGPILKKNVSVMLKTRKTFIKVRVSPKLLVKYLAKALIKEIVVSGIAGTSASNRIIRLP